MMIKINMLQDNYEELTTELLSLEYRINESLSIPLENCIKFVTDDYIKQINQLNLYLYELNLIITQSYKLRFDYSQKIRNLYAKIETRLNKLKDVFQVLG